MRIGCCVLVAALAAMTGQGLAARESLHGGALVVPSEPGVVAPLALGTGAVGLQVSQLVTLHFATLERSAPRPSANSTDPDAIRRRLRALEAVSEFVRVTAAGLTEAAADDDTRRQIADELAPVLADFDRTLSTELVALLNHPLVQEHGWFVISRFGPEADRAAGRLVCSRAFDRVFLARLVINLQGLASRGETNPAVPSQLAALVSAAFEDSVAP